MLQIEYQQNNINRGIKTLLLIYTNHIFKFFPKKKKTADSKTSPTA